MFTNLIKAALPMAGKLIFDKSKKVIPEVIGEYTSSADAIPEKNFIHNNRKYSLLKSIGHGGKKGLPVALATLIAKVITTKFPEYQFDPILLISVISGIIFIIVNILKRRFGVSLKGIL